MELFDIILLSIGLAMDCFAVSIATGLKCRSMQVSQAYKMPLLFGLFQGAMPLIGFLLSISFAQFIDSFSHWISLGILSVIGIKMIVEEFESKKDEDDKCAIDFFHWKRVLLLAVATSIDALATGIIFVSTPDIILWAVSIIALGSFLFSIAGLYIGHTFGSKFTFKAGILGGVILICIGIKIVLEHYV
jgi:putative Mn2+ efflux pump MntP